MVIRKLTLTTQQSNCQATRSCFHINVATIDRPFLAILVATALLSIIFKQPLVIVGQLSYIVWTLIEGAIKSVRTLRAFLPQGQSKLSVIIMKCPSYAAGVRIAGFDCILGFFRPVSNVVLEPC